MSLTGKDFGSFFGFPTIIKPVFRSKKITATNMGDLQAKKYFSLFVGLPQIPTQRPLNEGHKFTYKFTYSNYGLHLVALEWKFGVRPSREFCYP